MPAGAVARAALAALALVAAPVLVLPVRASASGRTPIVFFPGSGTTRLKVVINGQSAAPGCPRSGTFEDGVGTAASAAFTQSCRNRLLTLRYDALKSRWPGVSRPSPGVRVKVADVRARVQRPALRGAVPRPRKRGLRARRRLRVAGYNWRLTPDMDGFLARTKRLIERTYRANGKRPVQLVGHSNGPLYAQYLLTHSSRAWKDTYIHGFTSIAGNFPGQGAGLPPVLQRAER